MRRLFGVYGIWFVVVCVCIGGVTMGYCEARGEARTLSDIKADILRLAQEYQGQGDPDFSKQNRLNLLVDELLVANPQPPVKERLSLLHGTWKQVWGAYDYRRSGARGVDPDTVPESIYQVVFPGGYYYNVTPVDEQTKVGLLRGNYELVAQESNFLKVRFTRFPGNKGIPEDAPIWTLAAKAENDTLPRKTSIVPGWIVYFFFGGGYLREVYTDDTMRITYGGEDQDDRADEFIYVMTRVGGIES